MEDLETQGIALPRLGLGTYRMDDRSAPSAVKSALRLGYRHIDTAAMYDNEAGVGAGIAAAGLRRDSVHVTTKVWYDSLRPAGIRQSLDASLGKLKLDFVDLYLVHWPAPRMDLSAIFETLVRLREEGLTRAIGVCNFTVPLLRRAVEEIGAPIACNQVEYHVMLDQTPLRRYMVAKSIPLIAYCPLAQGNLADSSELVAIGQKHGASAAQVALKWLLDQEGVAAIPKAGRRESQQANLDALKIVLDDDDRRIIAGLPKDRRCVDPSFAPAWDKPAAG
jgi:2,5-diketo-D-gluconate reductase B